MHDALTLPPPSLKQSHATECFKKGKKPHPSQNKIQLSQKCGRFDLLECSLSQPQGTDFCSRLYFSRYGAGLCCCLFHCAVLEAAHTPIANYTFYSMGFQCKTTPLRIQQEQVRSITSPCLTPRILVLGGMPDPTPPRANSSLFLQNTSHGKTLPGKTCFVLEL